MNDHGFDNTALMLWYIAISLCAFFPFLTLFGFFENRKNGDYRFRTRRFLATVFCLIGLNLVITIVTDYDVADLIIGGSKVAEQAVLSNRAVAEYRIRNEAVMFPEILNDKRLLCYRAAFSNYIEDHWNEYVHEESCKNARHICANNETDYYNALLKNYHRQRITNDLDAVGIVLGSIWVTAADMYNLTRRLQRTPDDKGHVPDPPDQQMLADYRHYLDTCDVLKLLPWANPDKELLITRPHLCFGSCP